MVGQKRRLSGEERRAQILREAVEVFARSNYKRAKVADIASAVGVTEAAIYRHFPTKKAIFIEILDQIHARILTFWQEEIDDTDDAIEVLRNMGKSYFQRVAHHPAELKVQFQAVSEADDEEIAARLRTHHEQYRAIIEEIVVRGIDQGSVSASADPVAVAYLFDGAGVLMNMMMTLSEPALDEEVFDAMASHLLSPLDPA